MSSSVTKQILVTDEQFVKQQHEAELERKGWRLTRVAELKASEDVLRRAIRGKHGYILGGIETVTDAVLDAADALEAIVFTGADYRIHIPAYAKATQRGIAIANAPGGNAAAVAEYTLMLMLAMTRNAFEYGRSGGDQAPDTTASLRDLSVGVVGMGHVGTLVMLALRALGVGEVRYVSRTRKYHLEAAYGLTWTPLQELLRTSDVVTLHIPKAAGDAFIGPDELATLRDGALLVNVAYASAVDGQALAEELRAGRIRAAFDAPPAVELGDLGLDVWFASKMQTAYNTWSANRTVSDMVTRSLINLLSTGTDAFLVNPDYKNARAPWS